MVIFQITLNFLDWWFFFSPHFIFTPLSFCLHGLCWKFYYNYYPCFSVDKVDFFPLTSFKIFSLYFICCSLNMKCPSVDMLVLILLFCLWTSWICGLVSVVLSLEIYQSVFPKSSFYWEMWYPSDIQMLILRHACSRITWGHLEDFWRNESQAKSHPQKIWFRSVAEDLGIY